MIRLLVVIAAAAINTLLAADVSGNWAGTMETNGRPVPIYLTLNQNVYGVFGTLVTISERGKCQGGFVQNGRGGGRGVSAPTLLYKEEPDYTEEARTAKLQGTVVLSVEIDPTGTATNFKVVRRLGLGLDEKAVEAVKKWKFKPSDKDDTPVTVAATIEVNFHL